jgi:TatD DNase family protein
MFAAVFACMRYIDSHAHLADAAFDADREDVIARARDAGAAAIVSIGESIAAADRAAVIATNHPRYVYHTAGIHPHDAADFDDARDTEAIRRHVATGAVAVGECGLDYHYDHSPRDVQRRAFESQLRLAKELDRPVVVHSREADADITAMIDAAARAGVRGVLHCFTGTHAVAEAVLSAGWYVSFSGIVTFKRWGDLELLRLVPDDRLLVESDSPYLAPVPFRGKRNEPSFVPHTVERLASARRTTSDALAELTADNTRRFFGLAMDDPRP